KKPRLNAHKQKSRRLVPNERWFCDRSMAEGRANTGAPANRRFPNCAAFVQFGVEEAPLLRLLAYEESAPTADSRKPGLPRERVERALLGLHKGTESCRL